MKYLSPGKIDCRFERIETPDQAVEIYVKGSKHAFLYVFLAALFEEEESFPIVLDNIPNISDLYYICRYAETAGARIEVGTNSIQILNGVCSNIILTEYTINCRTALLAFTLHALTFGSARIYNRLGGCVIGERQIDQHIRLWNALGFRFETDGDYLSLKLEKKEAACGMFSLDFDTTMGTVAAIFCLRHGKLKRIENASTRPEVNEVIRFYSKYSPNIQRDGRTVSQIASDRRLNLKNGVHFRIMDDIDEAIAWTCLCHALRVPAIIHAKLPSLLVLDWLREKSDGQIHFTQDRLLVAKRSGTIQKDEIVIEASFHPDIGSDQQPILAVWASLMSKRVVVIDHKFTARFAYMNELKKIGWCISEQDDHKAIFEYDSDYVYESNTGMELKATDLRGGFAEMMGILIRGGSIILSDFEQIQRGYSDVEDKLKALGVVCHIHRYQIPMSVAAIIRHHDGRYYMQQRDLDVEKNPGKITFFGGGIEAGETPEDAIKRELREELGLITEVSLLDDFYISERFFSTTGIVSLFYVKEPVALTRCYEGSICLIDGKDLLNADTSLFVRCIIEICFKTAYIEVPKESSHANNIE